MSIRNNVHLTNNYQQQYILKNKQILQTTQNYHITYYIQTPHQQLTHYT